MFIDSHCHLDASEFDADRDATVNRALRSGVQLIIVPGVATSNFKTVADLASRHPAVYYALGIHPIFIPDAADADLETLEIAINKAMDDPKFIGIGEIGLDFFYLSCAAMKFARSRSIFIPNNCVSPFNLICP
nr:TatD family hydrolase [Paenalcaligenes niemegkensis]